MRIVCAIYAFKYIYLIKATAMDDLQFFFKRFRVELLKYKSIKYKNIIIWKISFYRKYMDICVIKLVIRYILE